MLSNELFLNRREIAKKICASIRKNNGKLINARYFIERPYCDCANPYILSSANFLRLLAADNDAIRKCNPRWVSDDDIKTNGWALRQNSKPELLEVWTKSSDGSQTCSLTKFYNAWDILDNNSFSPQYISLEEIIDFFQARGLIENNSDMISFLDCIDAVKKYANDNGADALISILIVQTWIAECKLHTKLSLFLPTYSDSLLAEIEQHPDYLFSAMNSARDILKKLRREKIISNAENPTADFPFRDLKIIYHGSELNLQNKNRNTYSYESILLGETAYEFLRALKVKASEETFRTWLEFSYKNYSHGKFLLYEKIPIEESISSFLRSRLDKNRQHLIKNPKDLKPYLPAGKTARADDLLQRINHESKLFQSVMNDFEQEEHSYLSNHPELCHFS